MQTNLCQCGEPENMHVIDMEDPWRALLEAAEYITITQPGRIGLAQLVSDCRESVGQKCLGHNCSCEKFVERDERFYMEMAEDAQLERLGL